MKRTKAAEQPAERPDRSLLSQSLLLALEPRFMFDGAGLAGGVDGAPEPPAPPSDDNDTANENQAAAGQNTAEPSQTPDSNDQTQNDQQNDDQNDPTNDTGTESQNASDENGTDGESETNSEEPATAESLSVAGDAQQSTPESQVDSQNDNQGENQDDGGDHNEDAGSGDDESETQTGDDRDDQNDHQDDSSLQTAEEEQTETYEPVAQRVAGPTEIVFVDANVRNYDVLLSDLWDPDGATDLGASLTEAGDGGTTPETGASPAGDPGDDQGAGSYDDQTGTDPAGVNFTGNDAAETSGSPDIQVVILDADRDGVEQITEYLNQYQDVAAVHILAHGSSGALRLGNTVLHHNNVKQYQDQLQDWGEAMNDDGDILIYGCNVAASDSGVDFVNELSQITGADVAASNDDTGASRFGGDWQLETTTGTITAGVVISPEAQLEWQDLMATVAVTTTLDINDGDTSSIAALLASPGGDGSISLREAVIAANNTAGNDFITLGAGTFTLTIPRTDPTAATGDLDIVEFNGDGEPSGKLTITGAGAGATIIDAEGLGDRVFHIHDGGHLEINDVTVTEGNPGADYGGGFFNESGILQINDSIVSDNSAEYSGGGIANLDGILEITNSRIVNNASEDEHGGGIWNENGIVSLDNVEVDGNFAVYGGGLANFGGIVTVIDSHFYDNTAAEQGGALFNNSGVLTVDETEVTNNYADAGGGGLSNKGGVVTINDSTFSLNQAGVDGGAIQNGSSPDTSPGAMTITGSTIENNTAYRGDGGGIQNEGQSVLTLSDTSVTDNRAYYDGGGIFNSSGTVIITDSHVDDNVAEGGDESAGGGIFNSGGGTLLVIDSTVDHNDANEEGGGVVNIGVATFIGSSVDDNTAGDDGGGIRNVQGTLALYDTTVNDNIAGEDEDGGGIANYGGRVLLVDSQVNDNTAGEDGGGILNESTEFAAGKVTLLRSEVSHNTAYYGGGIHNDTDEGIGAQLTAFDSEINNNTAYGVGGGIFNDDFGHVTLYNTQVNDNRATYGGGGIFDANGGQLNVANSQINNNTVGDAEAFGVGGGIFGYSSQISLYNSTVNDNTAYGHGGGLFLVYGSTLLAANSQINENDATYGYGGGIAARGGVGLVGGEGEPASTTLISLHNTSVDDNTAFGGGGIAVYYSMLSAVDSSISNNTAYYDGGGIHALYSTVAIIGTSEDASQLNNNRALGDDAEGDYGEGGAILSRYGPLTLINTEVDNNTAYGDGGAVHFNGGTLTVIDVNVENNAAGDDGGAFDLRDHTTFVVDSTFSENDAGDNGGAINARYGNLTIDNSYFTNNTAGGPTGDGGAIDFRGYGDGLGGITLYDFTLTNSTVTGNTAAYDGGGLHLHYANAVIRDSVISNNTSNNIYGGGGGIFSFDGNLHIHSSEIDGNTAANDGGGVFVLNESEEFGFSITDSSLTGNTADDDGGGLHEDVAEGGVVVGTTFAGNTAGYDGGGIYTEGELDIINSTLSGNTAGGDGGGIFDESEQDTNIVNATIVLNTAYGEAGGVFGDATDVKNTIIALNVDAGDASAPDVDGLFNSFNHNFIGADTTGDFIGAENQTGTLIAPIDPMLYGLADNGSTLTLPGGGVPQTHAPRPGSPVIDAAAITGLPDIAGLPGTDQRSFLRPVAESIDIGALEYGATVIGFTPTTEADVVDNDTSSTANLLADVAEEGSDISLRELIIASNNTPGSEIINLDGDLGTYLLYRGGSGDDTAAYGDLDILDDTGKITVRNDDDEDADPVITTDDADDRIFHLVGRGTALHLDDVEVTYGYVGPGSGVYGGGILVDEGYLRLDEVDVLQNQAGDDAFGSGGGIANLGGQVFIHGSNIDDNQAYNDGGGIFNENGLLRVSGSTIGTSAYGNQSGDEGGGVSNRYGVATFSTTFVEHNTAGVGGGLANRYGVVYADETVFGYNEATDGGGITNAPNGVLFLTGNEDNDIVHNDSNGGGGGVINFAGSVAVFDQTQIQNNYAGLLGGGGVRSTGGSAAFFLNGAVVNDNEAQESSGGAVVNLDGTALLADSDLRRNLADDDGGGLSNRGGVVQLIGTEVVNNEAYGRGGGIFNYDGVAGLFNGTTVIGNGDNDGEDSSAGGGIFTGSETGTASLLAVDATVNGNVTDGSGGGIHNFEGSATLVRTTVGTQVAGNEAGQQGGGIYSTGSRAHFSLVNGSVSGNGAYYGGGGIANVSGSSLFLLESNESISYNVVQINGTGGGILNQSETGGAIVFDTTIADNQTVEGEGGGGGVHNSGSSLIVLNSGINGNEPIEGSPGGGLLNNYGGARALLVNTEIDDNMTVGAGGSAVHNSSDVVIHGGDIRNNHTELGGNGTVFNFSHLVLNDTNISHNETGDEAAGGDGGGVFNDGGNVFLLNDTTVAYNEAEGGDGGGIVNNPESTTNLFLVGAAVRNNYAEGVFSGGVQDGGSGGGIDNRFGADLFVVDSSVAYNRADVVVNEGYSGVSYGGGINNPDGGRIWIQNSHVDNNKAAATLVDDEDGEAQANGGGIANQGGFLLLNDSTVDNNSTGDETEIGGDGGGIHNTEARLLMRDSSVSYNSANESDGGGIFNVGSTTDIFRSSIDGNFAAGAGGGLFNSESTVRITQSSIDNNLANYGGGVANVYGGVLINLSTVDDNSSLDIAGLIEDGFDFEGDIGIPGLGGGILNFGGFLGVTSSSVSQTTEASIASALYGGNVDALLGGGILNANGYAFIFGSTIADNVALAGGGVLNVDGQLTMINNTVSGNLALAAGGIGHADLGFVGDEAEALLINNTITDNYALIAGGIGVLDSGESMTLHNTIVAGNRAILYAPDVLGDFDGASSYNFIGNGDSASGFGDPSNFVGTTATPLDPMLNSLAVNSSPFRLGPGENQVLLTHLPQNGSPVIDAGGFFPGGDLHPSGDQRNVNRPVGFFVDIGALERDDTIDVPGGGGPGPVVTVGGGPGGTTVTVTPTPPGDPPGVIFTGGMNERFQVFEREYPRLLPSLLDLLDQLAEGLIDPLDVELERLILLTYQEVLFINGLIPEPAGDDFALTRNNPQTATAGADLSRHDPGDGDTGSVEDVRTEPVDEALSGDAAGAMDTFTTYRIESSATLSTQLHNAESFESGRAALLAAALAVPVARRNKGDP